MIDLLDIMEDYEAGSLDTEETLELSAKLIRTGRVWNLGDPYLNEALYLINGGYVTGSRLSDLFALPHSAAGKPSVGV
jgi:hypothetical protein